MISSGSQTPDSSDRFRRLRLESDIVETRWAKRMCVAVGAVALASAGVLGVRIAMAPEEPAGLAERAVELGLRPEDPGVIDHMADHTEEVLAIGAGVVGVLSGAGGVVARRNERSATEYLARLNNDQRAAGELPEPPVNQA
jgi:hypothetical protein